MATVPLITNAVLEEMIGRDLTPHEAGRATYYTRNISAFIASYCDLISFEEVEGDVKKYQSDYYGIIELGGGPISEVTTVASVDGTEVTGWTFDGMGRLHGLGPFQTVNVTYTHGEDVVPDDIIAVAAEAVLSCITTQVSGPLKTRTVGDVTYAFQEGTNAVAVLSENVLERYKTTEYTWRLGAHSASVDPTPLNWFQSGW